MVVVVVIGKHVVDSDVVRAAIFMVDKAVVVIIGKIVIVVLVKAVVVLVVISAKVMVLRVVLAIGENVVVVQY